MYLPPRLHVLSSIRTESKYLSVYCLDERYIVAFPVERDLLQVARILPSQPRMHLRSTEGDALLEIRKEVTPDWEWFTETLDTSVLLQKERRLIVPYLCLINSKTKMIYRAKRFPQQRSEMPRVDYLL